MEATKFEAVPRTFSDDLQDGRIVKIQLEKAQEKARQEKARIDKLLTDLKTGVRLISELGEGLFL